MKAANISQMRAIDSISINEYGIAGLVLMENAGRAVAEHALALNKNSYAVICGTGNNGGDGFVAARHLYNNKKKVTVVLVGDEDRLSGDARTNYDILKRLSVKMFIGLSETAISSADVIIDALLGIGASGAPGGAIKDAIIAINKADKTVVSVDVPSGINADNGSAPGECVTADMTVTLGVNKVGLVCYPGVKYAGKVVVCDISFAPQAVERQDIKVNIITGAKIPVRSQNSHKGSFGKVFALCGSQGFAGAAYLSSVSAMKTGCGLVTLGIPCSLADVMAQKLTEVITLPLADREGRLSSDCIPVIDSAVSGSDALICGCGLGKSADLTEVVTHIIRTSKIPIVLDADGINAITGHKDILKGKLCEAVITPHLGEMSRLLGVSVCEIQNNSVCVAKEFATEYNVVTVLKGANTIVALPDGEVFINTGGNSGMATAGSGDVLAGIIGALIAQGLPLWQAAVSGVFIHSRAGKYAREILGEHGMLAGDILSSIPYVIREEVISNG